MVDFVVSMRLVSLNWFLYRFIYGTLSQAIHSQIKLDVEIENQ